MATVVGTETILRNPSPLQAVAVRKWTPLTAANNVGDAYEWPWGADKSVQVAGTFGGATIVIQGSNDGTNYHTLTDPQGNAVSFTVAGIEAITENTRYIRPSLSGGDGTTSLTVTLLCRRPTA
jgi:hypothetical protein